MKVRRIKGIELDNFTTNFSTNTIDCIGSGYHNDNDSKVIVNGNTLYSDSNQGLHVLILNDDLTIDSSERFNVYVDDNHQNVVDFINSNLSDNQYFIILTNGLVNTTESFDDYMEFELYSHSWIQRGHFREKNLDGVIVEHAMPYSAFGSYDLGIVYESYARYTKNVYPEDAQINVSVNDYNSLGSTGYGSELVDNLYTGSFNSETIDLNSIQVSQYVTIVLNARGNGSTVNILENDSNIEASVTFDSNIWTQKIIRFWYDRSNEYSIELNPNNDDFELAFLSIQRSGLQEPELGDAQLQYNKVSKTLSAHGIIESNNVVNINDKDSVLNGYEHGVKIFDTDSTSTLFNENVDSVNVSGSITSSYIELSTNKDYVVPFWVQCNDSDDFKVIFTFYDEDENETDVYTLHNNFGSEIEICNYPLESSQTYYMEFYITARYTALQNLYRLSYQPQGELGTGSLSPVDVNTKHTVPRMTEDVKYVRITVETSDSDLVLPYIDEYRHAFANDGIVYGSIVENSKL